QTRSPEALISELDLLTSFLTSGRWDANATVKLPESARIAALIGDRSRWGHLDDDGRLVLADIEAGARQIIDRAHALAQLRGVTPIPSRIMFISFLLDEHGYAARLCDSRGVHIESLIAMLLAFTGGEVPETFALGDSACSRIVKPTLDQ